MSILNNRDRCSYLDTLKPDLGFKVDYILGTTYSLELDTLLMSSLNLCITGGEDMTLEVADPIALLEGCRRLQDVSVILLEPGQIKQPKKYNQLYYFIEQSLYPVQSPKGGVFHPKIWFIKYSNAEKEEKFRFICLSRNMTFDTSWDFALVLGGEEADTQSEEGRQLEKFFKELKPKNLKPQQELIYNTALDEMKRVHFTAPNKMDFSFHTMGLKKSEIPFLAEEYDRQCIVSPFLSESLPDESFAKNENILISCEHEVHGLSDEDKKKFKDIFVIDDALFDFGSADQDKKAAYEDVGSDLHAKMYFLEKNKYTDLFLGSANATNAAFSSNVEFLVRLRGKQEQIGINQFLGDDHFGFKTILKPYTPGKLSEKDKAEKKNELLCLRIKKTLFGSELKYSYEEIDGKFSLTLSFVPCDAWTKLDHAGFEVKVGLLTESQSSIKLIDGVTFNNLDISSLSSLFNFEVHFKELDDTKTFIQRIAGPEFPQKRSDFVIRNSIDSMEKFLKFLFLILNGGEVDADIFGPDKGKKGKLSSNGMFSFHIPVFEELLKSLSRTPEKLEHIEKVIQGINDKEGTIIPIEFSQMWGKIKEARGILNARS